MGTPAGDPARSSGRSLSDHLDPQRTPKRILALDGGGVRGILTLQYLARIEKILRGRYANPDYVLADYFDLIGGTSTGAIIASALALGFEVSRIQDLYTDLAKKIFKKPFFRLGAFVPKFGHARVVHALKEAYGAETTLGSPRIRTGLMVMTKRMDTGSPWPITNNPSDQYFLPVPGKKRIGSANMLLWQVVRASTAAPHYFRPEDLEVGRWIDPQNAVTIVDRGQFVDGGVSTANNPSLILVQVAMLQGYAFNWSGGQDNLTVISIGTGLRDRHQGRASGFSATAGAFAFRALLSIMDDCNNQNELMMQWLSHSPTARPINWQVKDLAQDVLTGAPILRYLRYNVLLEQGWVKANLQLDVDQSHLNDLAEMDRPSNVTELAQLGAKGAELLDPGVLP